MEAIMLISLAIAITLSIASIKGGIKRGTLQALANVAAVGAFVIALAAFAINTTVPPPDDSTPTLMPSSASSSSVADQDPEEDNPPPPTTASTSTPTLTPTSTPTPTSTSTSAPVPTETATPVDISPTPNPSLDEGLVAYYPFSGDARDHSGNEHHGMVLGASPTTDRWGNPDNAYLFNGQDNFILIRDAPELRAGLKSISVAFWFISLRQERRNPLITKFLNGRSKDWGVWINNGYYEFTSENGTSIHADYICRQETRTIQPNQWYFAVFVASEPTLTLYLDGKLVGICSNFVDRWIPTEANVEIGRSGYLGDYFRGTIDDVRIYDRALSEQEIVDLYNERSP